MGTERPRKGDKVWDRNRFILKDAQSNGFIKDIDWEEREVTVSFYDETTEQFSFSELEGCWEHRFGGTYMIYPSK